MKHFTHLSDLTVDEIQEIFAQCEAWKKSPPGEHLKGKLLGMVFFNPSLRTRTSFEAAMLRGGGHGIVLEVGAGVWKLEDRDGVVMDQDKTEHLKEAVPVLGRYVDGLAVRTFAKGEDFEEDHADPVINGFRKYSEVPVLSMESAREHPFQGLADLLTLKEKFGTLKGLPVTLSWAPHVKTLPNAVPNSFLLTAAACGCEVRVAHPQGYDLHSDVVDEASKWASKSGGSIRFTHDQVEGLHGSAAIYAKAWGPGQRIDSWMPTLNHFSTMREDAVLLHCLPVRRGLEVGDDVLDSPRSLVTDEAENRFHVQRAILNRLLGSL